METERSTIFLKQFLANPQNRELFGKFIDKYTPRLKRRCLRRGLQDADADDLVATILLRFCERDVFDNFVFQTKGKFYSWLDTVVCNDVLTFFRNRGRKPDTWSVGNADAQDALRRVTEDMVSSVKAEFEEDLARVEIGYTHVKERVGEKTWQVFWMLVFDEQTVETVMAHFEMTKHAVYGAKARVMRMLREALTGLHDSTEDQKSEGP